MPKPRRKSPTKQPARAVLPNPKTVLVTISAPARSGVMFHVRRTSQRDEYEEPAPSRRRSAGGKRRR